MKDIEVLLVDIGNSKVKITPVSDGKIGETQDFESMSEAFSIFMKTTPCIISATGRVDEEEDLLRRKCLFVNHQLTFPIEFAYSSMETLGADRICMAVGASVLFPSQNSLIVDVGTCLTIDILESGKFFKGGVISPGLRMRMKAMSYYTNALPDISDTWESIESYLPGKSTNACIKLGAFDGMVHEINGFVDAFSRNFTTINVILSGGDSVHFESRLKAHIFAGCKIMQEGLYTIWKHNKDWIK
ncbi:MAG: type III pantothenate kinase [Bacteroidota bacterium]